MTWMVAFPRRMFSDSGTALPNYLDSRRRILRCCRDVRCAAAAPEQRADPRNQLTTTERVNEIVIRACIESKNSVSFAIARRKHDQRNVIAARPQTLT